MSKTAMSVRFDNGIDLEVALVPYQGRLMLYSGHGQHWLTCCMSYRQIDCFSCCADAVVRGHRSGLLTTADYNNLCQCETLDDIKLNLVNILLPACDNFPFQTMSELPHMHLSVAADKMQA